MRLWNIKKFFWSREDFSSMTHNVFNCLMEWKGSKTKQNYFKMLIVQLGKVTLHFFFHCAKAMVTNILNTLASTASYRIVTEVLTDKKCLLRGLDLGRIEIWYLYFNSFTDFRNQSSLAPNLWKFIPFIFLKKKKIFGYLLCFYSLVIFWASASLRMYEHQSYNRCCSCRSPASRISQQKWHIRNIIKIQCDKKGGNCSKNISQK